MCDQNAQIPAETIWKLRWKGQLSARCSQKSEDMWPKKWSAVFSLIHIREQIIILLQLLLVLHSSLFNGHRAGATTPQLRSWSTYNLLVEIGVPCLLKQEPAVALPSSLILCIIIIYNYYFNYPANHRVHFYYSLSVII